MAAPVLNASASGCEMSGVSSLVVAGTSRETESAVVDWIQMRRKRKCRSCLFSPPGLSVSQDIVNEVSEVSVGWEGGSREYSCQWLGQDTDISNY